MTGTEVMIADTGCANLASVAAAVARAGGSPRVTQDPALIRDAARAVLPGVGAFGPGMAGLRKRGLDDAIRERVRTERPLLAICLGMQLLCESSEESPGTPGLGVIPTRVRRFRAGVRVPQMGWNRIRPSTDAGLLREGWMYFANSFRIESIPDGWWGSTTEYGGEFASAIERGPLLACQFHPELSGREGLALIARWLAPERVLAC